VRVPTARPGKKHTRPIVLEDWQQSLVRDAPMHFIRGCILSDRCYFVNRTGRYRYPSYEFANSSEDIADLFTAACDRIGVEYRRYRARLTRTRIYKRDSVAVLLRAVGQKA
jgi:hypothetical protein